MKYTLVALLLFVNSIWASAQKNNLFADVGLGASGFSVTYNYKIVKHFAAGIGVQGNDYQATFASHKQFIPAAYVDLRGLLPRKKHMFFIFLDFGMNFYNVADSRTVASNGWIEEPAKNNGIYTGIGLGYFRSVTKHGSGPYASLKMVSNTFKGDIYQPSSPVKYPGSYTNSEAVISVGFKF